MMSFYDVILILRLFVNNPSLKEKMREFGTMIVKMMMMMREDEESANKKRDEKDKKRGRDEMTHVVWL